MKHKAFKRNVISSTTFIDENWKKNEIFNKIINWQKL